MKKYFSVLLGAGALLFAVALNLNYAVNDYGVIDNEQHACVLAQSNSSGGDTSGGGTSGGGTSGGDSSGGGTTGGDTSGGGTTGGGATTGDNTSNCWKEEGIYYSGRHFTKCKSGTSTTNILICDGIVNDHMEKTGTSGKCHPNPVQ
jgi:hypothetical protein